MVAQAQHKADDAGDKRVRPRDGHAVVTGNAAGKTIHEHGGDKKREAFQAEEGKPEAVPQKGQTEFSGAATWQLRCLKYDSDTPFYVRFESIVAEVSMTDVAFGNMALVVALSSSSLSAMMLLDT